MLDKLLQLVREQGQQIIQDNPDVPGDKKEGIVQEAASVILSHLGGLSTTEHMEVMSSSSHPSEKSMQHDLCSNIIEKFGISKGVANSIATTIIPAVLAALRGGNSGVDLSSLLSGDWKSQLGNIGGKLGGISPGDVGKAFGF